MPVYEGFLAVLRRTVRIAEPRERAVTKEEARPKHFIGISLMMIHSLFRKPDEVDDETEKR